MNAYGMSSSRQTPRLQNTQKTGLGNALSGGWGGAAPAVGLAANSSGTNAPSTGPNRSGQLSGFAQIIGGSAVQTQIDMSDFPSLSNPRPTTNNLSTANWATGSTLRQSSNSLSSHQQHLHAQISQNLLQHPRGSSNTLSQQSLDHFDGQRPSIGADQSVGSEEFPPLGGQTSVESTENVSRTQTSNNNPILMEGGNTRSSVHQTQLPIREVPASQDLTHGTSSATQPRRTSQNGLLTSPSAVKRYADMNDVEKWTLPGLMAAFEGRRINDAGGNGDETIPTTLQNAVFLGQDLTNYGLDLDSNESLCGSFAPFTSTNGSASLFDFHDRHNVPDFALPSAYTVTNVPPLSSRLNAFSDETLFAVFYQHPRDILQEMAAIELTVRDWRWHKVLRQWLQKDSREANAGSSLPIVDLASGAPIGTSPVRVAERTERGVYVFFDALNWRRERREFILDYEQLDHRHAAQAVVSNPGLAATVGATAQGLAGSGLAFAGAVSTPNAASNVQQVVGSSQLLRA